jgi:hypothetical protein
MPDGSRRGTKPFGERPGLASGGAVPDGRGVNAPGSAPRSGLPYGGEPGSAPRSGTPYGSGPYGSAQAGGIAPRSAPGYGGATPPGSPPASAPRSGIPRSGASYGGGDTYGSDESYRGGGRRRAGDDLPPPPNGRRSAPDSGAYGEALSSWRGDPEPTVDRGVGLPSEAPSWSRGSADAGNGWRNDPDPGSAAPARGGWENDLGRGPGRPNGPGSRETDLGPADARGAGRQNPGGDWRAELDSGPPVAAPSAEPWNGELGGRQDEPAWQRAEREDAGRGGRAYRDSAEDDWRKDLSDRSGLAEGESRRYGTSDYIPFRSSGSAAVQKSNLSSTSTSMISPVPREQREAQARPPRTSNGYQGLSGSYERRAMSGGFPMSRRSNLLDPDDEEDEQETGGPLAAVGYTVIWYGVPVVLFLAYMLVTGSQSQAVSTLTKAAPQFGISLVLSILIAVGIRWVSDSWKAISVGLAAAVVGGGLATVLTSAITGNSLS